MSRQIYCKLGECGEAKQGGNHSYEVIDLEIGEDTWLKKWRHDRNRLAEKEKNASSSKEGGRKVCAQQRMCMYRA